MQRVGDRHHLRIRQQIRQPVRQGDREELVLSAQASRTGRSKSARCSAAASVCRRCTGDEARQVAAYALVRHGRLQPDLTVSAGSRSLVSQPKVNGSRCSAGSRMVCSITQVRPGTRASTGRGAKTGGKKRSKLSEESAPRGRRLGVVNRIWLSAPRGVVRHQADVASGLQDVGDQVAMPTG